MAGHNKWSKVKRLTGALDANRGKLFSQLAKETTFAARTGSGSPDAASRLRGAFLFSASMMENQVMQTALAARADEVSNEGGHHEAARRQIGAAGQQILFATSALLKVSRFEPGARERAYLQKNQATINADLCQDWGAAQFLQLSHPPKNLHGLPRTTARAGTKLPGATLSRIDG